MTQTLEKKAGESRLYGMDFAGLLDSGVTLSSNASFTITPSTGTVPLTKSGSVTLAGTVASFRLLGGDLDMVYTIDVVCVDSAGNTIEGDGKLRIIPNRG